MTNWLRNEDGPYYDDELYSYQIYTTNGDIFLWIKNKKTRKELTNRIMNRDPIFIEQEADCIIKRLKENNKI